MALNAGTVNQVVTAMPGLNVIVRWSLLSKSKGRISRIVESTGGSCRNNGVAVNFTTFEERA